MPKKFIEAGPQGREDPSIQNLMEKEVLKGVGLYGWGLSKRHPHANDGGLAKWIGHLHGLECGVAFKNGSFKYELITWENSPQVLIKVKGGSS